MKFSSKIFIKIDHKNIVIIGKKDKDQTRYILNLAKLYNFKFIFNYAIELNLMF